MRGYRDRHAAGTALAGELADYRDDRPVVLGIPRGGVVLAADIAAALDGELDVVIARKVGAPFNPELAIGAVGVDGIPLLDDTLIASLAIGPGIVEAEVARQTAEARRRLSAYRGDRPPPPIAGRSVIVVDDGVATGATMKAVLVEVRRQAPRRLICAVPCGPPQTIRELSALADEVVCPLQPPTFMAVGQWYRDFAQVTDEEVIALLAGA